MFVNKITKLGYFKCDKDDKKDGNIMNKTNLIFTICI